MATLFLMVGVSVGAIYYLGSGERNALVAAVVGAVAGLLIVALEMRWREAPDEARRRALDRFPYFPALVAACGVGLLVAAGVMESWRIAASGVVFVALAVGFLVIRYALRRASNVNE